MTAVCSCLAMVAETNVAHWFGIARTAKARSKKLAWAMCALFSAQTVMYVAMTFQMAARTQ